MRPGSRCPSWPSLVDPHVSGECVMREAGPSGSVGILYTCPQGLVHAGFLIPARPAHLATLGRARPRQSPVSGDSPVGTLDIPRRSPTTTGCLVSSSTGDSACVPYLVLLSRRSANRSNCPAGRVAPGGCPPGGPHRSVLAQLTHTARRCMESLPAAIRWGVGDTSTSFKAPGIFPSSGLMARRPLPSTGSLGSVPPLPRYYEALRLPAARPAALRCLRLAVPVAPAFRSRGPRRSGRGPGVGHPVPPAGTCREGEGASQVPGEPLVNVPCSPTPAGSRAPGHCGAATRPSVHVNNVGSRDDVDFGAQWHGPLTRCLRFAARVAPAPRKTRFRPLAKLCRAGLVTRRVPIERFPRYIASPFPKLSWRDLILFHFVPPPGQPGGDLDEEFGIAGAVVRVSRILSLYPLDAGSGTLAPRGPAQPPCRQRQEDS